MPSYKFIRLWLEDHLVQLVEAHRLGKSYENVKI
jgi:hypothetical protein